MQVLICPSHVVGAVYSATGAGVPGGRACTPWRSGAVRPGHDQELVYAITPARPGTVRISGADVTYADGIRSGSQRAGGQVIVRVR